MKKLAVAALLAGLASLAGGAELRLQVSDRAGQPVEHAVLWLKPVNGSTPPVAGAPKHAVIDQLDRNFKPLVTVLRTGTPVDFPNSDNIRHSVYSFSPARTFTLKLYSGKPSEPVVFDKEGLITLGCNIHDQMIAWVVAVDTPWFAQSSSTGAVTLVNLPEGDYVLAAWHPGLKDNVPVTQKLRVDTSTAPRPLQLDAKPVASLLPDSEGQVHGTMEH